MHTVVKASEVKAGDYIYDKASYRPCDKWVRVRSVAYVNGHTVISVFGYDTWKHPDEGVAILIR